MKLPKLWPLPLIVLIALLTACPGPTPPPLTPPVIANFKAEPASLPEGGGNVNLTWAVTGAESLTLNPGDLDVTSTTSKVVSPTATTTYTLTATNTAGSSTAKTTVTVSGNAEPLEPVVNPDVSPTQPSIPGGDGNPRPIGTSRDEQGVQTDFVLGEMLIHPDSDQALQEFLTRYGAEVTNDNAVPEPPEGLGITLTAAEREATEYLVRFDLAAVDLADLKENAAKLGLGGLLELSSEDALRTLAGITDAAAAGYSVSPNFAAYPDQAFPTPLFRTIERGGADAFATTPFQATGSQSNVTLAWQFVAAHGIKRRVRVAIIDGGFWLDANGQPLTAPGDGSDLPVTGIGTCQENGSAAPCQYDIANGDGIAGDPNPATCTGGSLCPWHGNGSAGVALGIVNNMAAAAGTGGLVADPLLLHTDIRDAFQKYLAIRVAVLWGADVINMSFGGPCNYWCRQAETYFFKTDDFTAFANSRGVVLVASAGNDGIDVVADNYVHPCLNDSVICVGALNDKGSTRISYSNFGSGVDIWAPTNIPAMADGSSGGMLINFNGTSASAPFVAGVAAMMKAINPNLNSDQVNQILRDTAHRGTAPVDFYIDAYAAVSKAAEGIDGVKDRFEPNNGPESPSQLGGAGPWNEANLNLHTAQDRDYYSFSSPQRSTLHVDVAYPDGLGAIPLLGLNGNEACGIPALTSDAPLPGGGRRLEYTVASGPHTLGLGGGLINAYNLSLSIGATAALSPDSYEWNGHPDFANHLYRVYLSGNGFTERLVIDPRITIDANLDTSDDVDFYTVRGAAVTFAEQILLNATPHVKVYGNESPVTLEVFNLNPDGSQGAPVGNASSQTCTGDELSVALGSGQSYLLKVSGGAGRYTLHNGVDGERRHIPDLAHGRIHEVLHPGVPVERVIRNPLIYVLTGDIAFSEVNVKGNLHLELFDFAGTLLAEGVPSGQGFDETLGLESMRLNGVYSLRITPRQPRNEGTPMTLSWSTTSASRTSDNLITNPDAEEGPGSDTGGAVESIEGWSLTSDLVDLATVIYYNGVNDLPDQDDPGPEDRGNRLFAGGPNTAQSSATQEIFVDSEWRAAIDAGIVKFDLSAFLGGFGSQADQGTLRATFLNANRQLLGEATLGPVTVGEREGTTGLFLVATSDYLPSGTYIVALNLEFSRTEGAYNDGYADNLELTLWDYSP